MEIEGSNGTAEVGSRDVMGRLNYSISKSGDKGWFIDVITNPDGSKLTNFDDDPRLVSILDMRDREQQLQLSLDTCGFQMLHSPTLIHSDTLLCGGNAVEELYYPEVERLLKRVTGADQVIFFDHTIRRSESSEAETPLHRSPVLRVHVDQTLKSAEARVMRHLPPGSPPFRRFQIINIWRPIKSVVHDYPLALLDFRSLDVDRDLVATEIKYPPWLKDKETFSVKYSRTHKWFYVSRMDPNEVLLFKCYDSLSARLGRGRQGVVVRQEEGVAGCCPHSAFLDEEGARLGIQRQSIEVRALVFYHYH